jgi:ADP-ribose pyrophosphatase YjhB (NUDIX family)
VPAFIRRWGYRAAARLLAVHRFVRRPTVRGVRCVLSRGDEVLLVRHTYGDRRWALPGGLTKRREDPEATARREMAEELGLHVASWRALGEIEFVGTDRAHHVVACFAAPAPDGELIANAAEIGRLRWFGAGALPDDMLDRTAEIVARARSA